ncbi:hypothetical protein F2Q68_00002801 [Brassica cretica]|uniref:Uncharacterized protein n=2 Tax=Brassica cretica TaxID=69181 RepID=A0ABQ7DWK9_BRACR|nr:hypothetical protein F2Q68_00002801 [Brassica cretica]KAF3581785.1 hypothetical protein DY000_02029313 [Brassica cretica]
MATEPPLRIEGVDLAPIGVEIEDLEVSNGTVAVASDLGVLGIGSSSEVGVEDATVSLSQYRIVDGREENKPDTGKQVVLKLMGELERVNVSQHKSEDAGCSYAQAEETSTTKFGEEDLAMKLTGSSMNGEPSSPVSNGSKKAVNGVELPNGFQVLSDIRDEGEIDEEEEEDVEEDENVVQETNGRDETATQEADPKSRGAPALNSQANSQKGKGKNFKKPMINNKSFIQAVNPLATRKFPLGGNNVVDLCMAWVQ